MEFIICTIPLMIFFFVIDMMYYGVLYQKDFFGWIATVIIVDDNNQQQNVADASEELLNDINNLEITKEILRFVDDNNYKCFTDECLKDERIMKIMQKIYIYTTTNQLQLDGDIERRIYLHAELNILVYIMD
ncbi:hypothetical protein RhiirA5_505621 [Rhizophagus irregularis]|uniref:Uncharacterized protein n=2 Tax=Rhizophagus irregularis TaxID=588596 RepID=A0A2N0NYK1_9GLOM|nr:hypothetical protein RhiirA5_505621 [Rhizophagus irregularis]